MNERELRDRLRSLEVPDQGDAEERARRVLESAWEDRPQRPGRRRARAVLVLAAAGLIALLALSSAGADVRDWIEDTIGSEDAAPSLTSLPAPGRLLVESAQGPWVVAEDGSQRRLGDYEQATWSPNGRYVVGTDGGRLVAMEPDGEVVWTVTQPGRVTDPDWQAPDGFRIAYRNGDEIRMVEGDGTGDRLVARGVASVAPAWRPGSTDVLALDRDGLLVRHAESGRLVVAVPFRSRMNELGAGLKELEWSRDGSMLAVNYGRAITPLIDGYWNATNIIGSFERVDGRLSKSPEGSFQLSSVEFSPSGRRIAYVRQSGRGDAVSSAVLIAPTRTPTSDRRLLFSGPGRFTDLAWSPDGKWLLVAWKDADQWLFINLKHPERVRAVGNISSQFDPGGEGPAPFPRISGWCCPE